LEAQYTASLAGIPMGQGNWIIDIGRDRYTGIATGRLSGILRLLARGAPVAEKLVDAPDSKLDRARSGS
jgi:hypothetical protein